MDSQRDKGRRTSNTQQDGGSNPQEISTEFNREEIEKLKNLLGSLEKPSTIGTCSLAFSGISSSSHAFRASDGSATSSWVIDSGATDHMT